MPNQPPHVVIALDHYSHQGWAAVRPREVYHEMFGRYRVLPRCGTPIMSTERVLVAKALAERVGLRPCKKCYR